MPKKLKTTKITAPKKTVKKTVKKAVVKPAKKTSVKSVKKTAPKKATVKKAVKPAAKKAVKKVVKPVNKTVKKAVNTVKKAEVKKTAAPTVKASVKPAAVKVKADKPEKAPKAAKLAAAPKAKVFKTTGFKSMPVPVYTVEETITQSAPKAVPVEITKTEIEDIRKDLESTKSLLQRRIAEKIELDMSETEVGDEIDTATQSLDKELLFEVNDNDHMQIEQIDAALRRIQLGLYGVCTSCRKSIPKKRLKALPFARYCINCQNNTEGNAE